MTGGLARFGLAGALFAIPALAVVAAWLFPGVAGPVLVAAGLACVVAALATVQSANARERARAALRGVAIPADAPSDEWRRVGAALALVVPAFVVAVLLVPLAMWRPRLDFTIGSPPRFEAPHPPAGASEELDTTGPAGPSVDESPGGAAGDPSQANEDPGGPSTGVRASSTGTSFTDPWLLRRVLLTVTPTRDGLPTGDLGALYLRGMVLPSIDGAGRFNDDDESMALRRDTDDGEADGWTRVGPTAAGARGTPVGPVDLDLHQFAISHEGTGWTLLHAPSSVTAVASRRVRAADDGTMVLPPASGEWVDYRVRCREPWRMPFPTDRTRVAVRDPRTLALPVGIPVVDTLSEMARGIVNGAGTDLARVRSVVGHLRANWSYEPIDGELTGMAALDVFVAERKGTCVQFAEAAALMLRSQGLPARVVHGFLARNFDASLGLYYARGRDYHAWVEVDFEGCGWVTFDATPVAPQDAEVRVAERPAPATDDTGAGGAPTFDGLTDSLQSLNAGVRDAVRESPWLAAALLLASVLALARVLRLRHERLSGIDLPGANDRTEWGRLLVALARHGHRRRPSQTALEFAAQVAASDTALATFVDLSRRQQAARFGGAELSREVIDRIDALRAVL